MVSNIGNLIAKGAKTVVALNLPDIGRTPSYKDNAQDAANASLFTESFNSQFAEGIAQLKAENSDVAIIDVDVYSIFNEILMNPESFGIDDVSQDFITWYQEYAGGGYVGEYLNLLFYDDVHPTTEGHKLIADAVYDAMAAVVPEPPSYAAVFGVIALAFVAYRKRK